MNLEYSSKSIAVVGGGIAGLSAAVHLASKGAHVTLFERNESIGGKLNYWRKDGFYFDTGPHVLTMLFAFERLFAAADERFEDSVNLVRLPSICRYHFPEGNYFDAPADPADAAKAIEENFPGNGAGFEEFLSYSRDAYDKTVDTFLTQDIAEAMRVGGPQYAFGRMKDFFGLKPFETLNGRISRHFTNEKLRQIFRLYALYSGSHPKRCSSIFSTVAHVQWDLGTYYIDGGLYTLVNAINRLLDKLGVVVRLKSEVTEIVEMKGRCTGIKILEDSDQRVLNFDGVICNQDVLTASTLLPRLPQAKVEPSTSAFLILAGVDGVYPRLAHHNSFLTSNEWLEYGQLFDQRIPPSDPTIGVSCQSVTDPTRAPANKSNLFIMANVPALGPEFSWDEGSTERYRSVVVKKLENAGLIDLEKRIVVEQVWTPRDFKRRYGAFRGAIYGLSSNGWKQAFFRPPQKSSSVRGLYFAGGSTHPGGGLPLCVLSGEIAARQLLGNI